MTVAQVNRHKQSTKGMMMASSNWMGYDASFRGLPDNVDAVTSIASAVHVQAGTGQGVIARGIHEVGARREAELRKEHNFDEIIGTSPQLLKLLDRVQSTAPTDATVLIIGETGSGKELIARAIHNRSARRDSPLVKVNCGAIPSGLGESELFGHVKGAFTSAYDALQAGACGYFLKITPPSSFRHATWRMASTSSSRIQTALLKQIAEHMGEHGLSSRECEILQLVADGHRNRDIGNLLFISEETVKVHLRHINQKLGAKDRTHAVVLADRRGIVHLDSDRWVRGANENDTCHRGMTEINNEL